MNELIHKVYLLALTLLGGIATSPIAHASLPAEEKRSLCREYNEQIQTINSQGNNAYLRHADYVDAFKEGWRSGNYFPGLSHKKREQLMYWFIYGDAELATASGTKATVNPINLSNKSRDGIKSKIDAEIGYPGGDPLQKWELEKQRINIHYQSAIGIADPMICLQILYGDLPN